MSNQKININDKVSYHPFIGKPAVSSGHIVLAVDIAPNNFGEDVAWISGKSGCISFSCLSVDAPEVYVLRDSRTNCGENMMFWRAGGGYTTNLHEAKHYTLEEAKSQNECRESDIPIRLSALLHVSNSRVDMQYLDSAKAKECSTDKFAFQVAGEYDGNDILFLMNLDGDTTYNYQDALVLDGGANLSALAELPCHYRIWPTEHLNEITRNSVQAGAFELAFLGE